MTSTTAPHAFRRLSVAVLALVSGACLTACDGAPASPDTEGVPTTIALSARFPAAASGDDGDAYDAADGVWLRLTSGSEVLVEEVLAFDPTAGENRVRVELELDEGTTLGVEAELRRGQDPLFRGSTSLTVQPGATAQVDIDLLPVPAGIVVSEPGPPEVLTFIGETVPLEGAVLFATGDTAAGLTVDWTSLDPQVADVVTSAGTVRARALDDGEARLRASHAGFTEIVTVTVDLQVVSVDVEPPSSTILAGETVQLVASARDAGGSVLTGRPPTWGSSHPSIASVDQDGLVQGARAGTAEISAVVDGVEGTAEVEVVATPPTVQTSPALDVDHRRARLRGIVNPRGTPTTAWFEWGTDPTLAASSRTTDVQVGSGALDVPFGTTVTGLSPGTRYYFRAVGTNEQGTERGEILSFDTPSPEVPSVVTLPATDIGTNRATLRASVNPNGSQTSAFFQFADNPFLDGPSTVPVPVGDGSTDVEVEVEIDDIAAERTHYFRVVATNSVGTAEGEILTFRTAVPPPSDLDGGFDGPTVFLGWDDNSTTNTYFRMERSVTSPTGGFEVVGIISDDSQDFDRDFFDEGSEADPLPTGTLYYRVFACTADDECSGASNVHSVVNLPSIGGYVDYCSDLCDAVGFQVTLTGPVTLVTLTDSAGFYAFSEVPTGSYTVTVREDYCPDFRVDFVPETKEVTVSSGAEFAVVDFAGNGLMPCGGRP